MKILCMKLVGVRLDWLLGLSFRFFCDIIIVGKF